MRFTIRHLLIAQLIVGLLLWLFSDLHVVQLRDSDGSYSRAYFVDPRLRSWHGFHDLATYYVGTESRRVFQAYRDGNVFPYALSIYGDGRVQVQIPDDASASWPMRGWEWPGRDPNPKHQLVNKKRPRWVY